MKELLEDVRRTEDCFYCYYHSIHLLFLGRISRLISGKYFFLKLILLSKDNYIMKIFFTFILDSFFPMVLILYGAIFTEQYLFIDLCKAFDYIERRKQSDFLKNK